MADKGRLWSAEYIMVLFSMLCNGMAGMMTVPLVAKYAIQTGADLTVASAVAGLMSLVALIICPFAGALCDRCSRKRILIFANFGYGCSLALHSVCTVLPALVLIRLITGVFFSVCTVANVAYSSSYIPNQRMGEGLGYVGLTTIVAQALGPSLGLELQEKGGFGLTFAVAGCFAAVCMISVILMPYQSSTVSEVKRKKNVSERSVCGSVYGIYAHGGAVKLCGRIDKHISCDHCGYQKDSGHNGFLYPVFGFCGGIPPVYGAHFG